MDSSLGKGFGSFQSPNVELLISQSDEEYVAPGILAEKGNGWIEEVEERLRRGELECGDGCKELFMIDFGTWTFLSHGALGGVLRPVYEETKWWREHCELQPLKFFDRDFCVQEFASTLSACYQRNGFVCWMPTNSESISSGPPWVEFSLDEDLCLLPNATAGLNVVISGIGALLKPGDSIFLLSISYAATKKIVETICEKTGAHMVTAEVTYPPRGPEEILEFVKANMPATAKLAIFDVVTSSTAMALPIHDLVQLCKKHSRGAAILHVKTNMQKYIKPFIVSHGSGHGFTSQFIWDGVEVLVKEWGTNSLLPNSLKCRCMALVRLPNELLEASLDVSPANVVQSTLHHVHRIEAPVKTIDGYLYIRVSVHIYTTEEDFKKLATAISGMASNCIKKK